MSVCIYSPSEHIWGGGQIYIDNLCRFLNDHGMEAVIASSEPESFSAPAMRMPSVGSKKRRLATAPDLARKLKRKGIKVIVLNDLSSLWLAPIFRPYGLKVVSLLHLYLQRKNDAGLGHGWLEFNLLRVTSRFAHRIFSVNKDNQKIFPGPVEFVGNFISPWFFDAAGSDQKRYDLGLIARFSAEKNVPLFIRLVANLKEVSERPISALIVGEGDQESLVRREIERLGVEDSIEIRPWVDRRDLPGIFDQVKCFAITSYHEGFATTLLEAHARGVPAITTRSAGYCAEFIEAGERQTGLVFEPQDIGSKRFLNNLLVLIDGCQRYAEPCKFKALQFSEERVLGQIQSGIEAILAEDLIDVKP